MEDYLCEGIIINILHRLPVKALLRCTSVCKSWYSLITSPEFISSHLKFAATSRKGTPLLLLRRCIRNSECYDLFLDNESFAAHATFEFPFRSTNSFFTIVGSCNGLLCLSDDRVYYMHTIVLWNPCIRKSILLPKPNFIYNSYGAFVQSLGFGYDPVGGDYKVVRVTYVDCCRGPPQVELYRLSTGVWQDMSYLALQYAIYNRSRQAYANGATHWLARYEDCYDLVVLFDMSHDVFREMTLPACLENNGGMRSKDLVVYMESLALILWNMSSVEPSFCVWVMKEYGVMESWTKHFSFDFHNVGGGFMRPLWVRKHGEVVTVWQDGHLVSYDPDGAEGMDLGVHGSTSEDYRRSIHVDGYMENLALLDRGSHFSDAAICKKLPTLQTDDSNSFNSYGSDYMHGHGSYAGNVAV